MSVGDRLARVVIAIALGMLGGCQTVSDVLKLDDLPQARGVGYGGNFVARNGSAVGGTVRVIPRDDGVAFTVYATALPPGRFRVVVHERGNCTSPNAFSAGAPWAPQGREPIVLPIAASSDGSAQLSVRLRGYKLDGPDGLVGKSVVLHEANGSLDAQPGVPNDRVACAVIGSMQTLF